MGDLTTIRNIGPAVAERLEAAGIRTADQLHEIGADRAYFLRLQAGETPHFIPYYALVMSLQGRPWNDCKGAEKAALRVRFDAICAEAAASEPATPELADLAQKKGHARLDAALAEIGVIRRAPAGGA